MKATVIVVAVIAVIAFAYFLSKGNSVSTPITQTPTTQTQGIKNDSELMLASNDLDNTDLNSVDNGLNQNQTDASSF